MSRLVDLLTILMSLIVAMLRTKRFTRTMAGPSSKQWLRLRLALNQPRLKLIQSFIFVVTIRGFINLNLKNTVGHWQNIINFNKRWILQNNFVTHSELCTKPEERVVWMSFSCSTWKFPTWAFLSAGRHKNPK